MLKQFIKDSGIYGVTGILSKGVSIFLVPFYTRVLTPTDYGIIDLVAVISAIVAVTVPLEISQAVARFLADSKVKADEILTSTIGLIITIITFSLLVVLVFIFARPITNIVFEKDFNTIYIKLAVITMFTTGLYYFIQNQLRWLIKPKLYAFVGVTYTIITISLTILMVLILKTGVKGVFIAQSISGLIAFILGYYFTKTSYAFVFSKSRMKEMLTFSFPLVPSSVAVFFINYIQRIIIKSYMGLASLGIYAVAGRISSIIRVVLQGIQGAATPLIYQKYKEPDTPYQLARIFNLLCFFGFFGIYFLSVFSQECMVLLTTKAFYSGYILIPFLLIEAFVSSMSVFIPGLSIAKKTKVLAILNIVNAILSFFISLAFIYFWNLFGAAIAVALQSIIVFFINYYYSQKEYFIPFEIKKIGYSFVIGFFLIFFLLILLKEISIYSIILKVATCILYIFILLKIGLIKKNDINKIKLKLMKN